MLLLYKVVFALYTHVHSSPRKGSTMIELESTRIGNFGKISEIQRNTGGLTMYLIELDQDHNLPLDLLRKAIGPLGTVRGSPALVPGAHPRRWVVDCETVKFNIEWISNHLAKKFQEIEEEAVAPATR